MSRSNPNADVTSNPATRFFEWSGSTGKVKYYDKADQQTYEVDLPFSFLVLDQLNTITGFSKKDQSGIWSNEVRNLSNDVLTVKTKNGVKAEGVYKSQAITNVLASGGKYTKSVYIAYQNDEKELVLAHIKLAGSAIGAWIEFTKANNVNNIAVVITEAKAEVNGTTNYFVPVFEARAVSKESDDKAKELDKELQDYLNQYMSRKPSQSEPVEEADDEEELGAETPESDGTEEAAPAPKPKAKPIDDGKIDIKDVPF